MKPSIGWVVISSACLGMLVGCDTGNPPAPSDAPAAQVPAQPPGAAPAAAGTGTSTPSAAAQPAPDEADLRALVEELQAKYDRPDGKPAAMAIGYQRKYLLNAEGRLQKIDLSYTPLTDEDLAKLAAATSIERLDLDGTKVTDEGVKHLKNYPKLHTLAIYFTNITDACIDDIVAIPALTYVGANSSGITKEGMERLKAAKAGLTAQ